ncbi:MAG: efflux RND transporter permease subunit, partial [Planctomycetales bacterium]|nr:efflux RND transporter permease subunit [Planctomycetales bacterium]
ASPEIMETDIVDPIEDAMMSVEGVREISASCRQGRASVNVEFDLERDIDLAIQDVQAKLGQAQRILPRDMDPPVVSKTNPEDQPIMYVSLSGPRPVQELSQFARDRVKDRLQTVPGAGEISLGGFLERNMRIWLKLEELEARELAVDDVLAALRREHIEVPAGRIETGERELNVRTMGEALSESEFRGIVVAVRNGAPVRLEQVAVVEDGTEDRRRVARAMGEPAVGLGIRKQRGANAVQVARGIRARMEEIQGMLPPDLSLGVNFDSTRFIEESAREIQRTLGLAVVLTSLVCLVFLGSWSSTFNILLSIPTSIVGTFIVIYFLGFTLNTFTLLSLTLAIGIVVDDAIMVLENIFRHRELGEARVPAASRGAREITFAAIAATFSILAIFLPIAFMQGMLGKFLYQFGVTMSVAVLLSLLEALTLTPMRCSQMLGSGVRGSALGRGLERAFRGLASAYGGVLGAVLRAWWPVRVGVVVLAVGLFGWSLAVGAGLRQEIVPSQDQSRFMVRMQTPSGSSLDFTDGKLREAEKFLASRPEVDRYFGFVGGFGGGEVDTGMLFVTLKPPGERGPRHMSQAEVMGAVRGRFNTIPDLNARVIDLSMSGIAGRGGILPIQFVVTGPDWPTLADLTEKIVKRMGETDLFQDEKSDYLAGQTEVQIFPDRQRAADRGVSMETIGTTVNALIGGVRTGKFKSGGHRYDVRVRLISDQRSRPEDVKRLFVRSRQGDLVRLSDLVRTEERPTVQAITRRNRVRAITVQSGLKPGVSQKDAMDVVRGIAAETLPPGYASDFSGASKLFTEAGQGFVLAVGLGVIIAYMILASQFNSYVHPFLVLLAMPLSVTGAILALRLADISLNLYSAIGFVLLMGIVKKNGILLVDFTNQRRREGLPVREALLDACPIRLRPILMTSSSTVAAAIPAAFWSGAGSETLRPMALVVIGGVVLSTLLTLLVVPCAYSLLPGRVRRIEATPDLVRDEAMAGAVR